RLALERLHRQVAEARGDANALELLIALHGLERAQRSRQIDELHVRKRLLQVAEVLPGHGAHQPHAPALDAALSEIRHDTLGRARAAPAHVGDDRHALGVGQVVIELYEERWRALAREDHIGLARP